MAPISVRHSKYISYFQFHIFELKNRVDETGSKPKSRPRVVGSFMGTGPILREYLAPGRNTRGKEAYVSVPTFRKF